MTASFFIASNTTVGLTVGVAGENNARSQRLGTKFDFFYLPLGDFFKQDTICMASTETLIEPRIVGLVLCYYHFPPFVDRSLSPVTIFGQSTVPTPPELGLETTGGIIEPTHEMPLLRPPADMPHSISFSRTVTEAPENVRRSPRQYSPRSYTPVPLMTIESETVASLPHLPGRFSRLPQIL